MKTYITCLKLVAILSVMLICSDSHAQFKTYAVGMNGGTNGFGLDATTDLTERLNLRATANFFSFNHSGEIDDDPGVDIESQMKTSNFSILLNFHPYNTGFALVAGMYYMNLSVDSKMIPNESYEVDGRVFEPERLGTMNALIEYPNKFAPYIGLGFGNPIGDGSRLRLNMQIGVLYTGEPKLTMTGTGMIAPTADNQPALQEGLNEFKWYPLINLGLSFRI